MTDAELWSLLIGAVLPPFIAVLQQPSWSRPLRTVVTVVVCVLVGFVGSYIRGDWTGRAITTAVLLTLVAALTTYRNLWKPTRVAGSIEMATSPGSDSPALNSER
jgi:L-lactate permease